MNPFFCYIASFSLTLMAYLLGWSALYPPLTLVLILFLTLTIAAQGVSGFVWKRGSRPVIIAPVVSLRNSVVITAVLYVLWSADFIYEGGVPLFKILFGRPYNYRSFGVPSLHVFTVTFGSFFTVLLYHQYLASKRREYIWLFLINLLAALLIYSRAMMIFNLTACCLIFIHLRSLTWRLAFFAMPGAVLLLFLFGIMGNLRVAREAHEPYGAEHFLNTGGATPEFRESFVPKEFFWGFVYASSPLANLQTNVNLAPRYPVTAARTLEMAVNEFTFDFISKRVNRLFDIERAKEVKIDGPFNVSTVYSSSFSYLNWYGMVTMAVFLLALPWLFLMLLPSDSPYFISGMAILSTLYLFLAYDNTFRLTGLGFQLVYPVALSWLARKGFSITGIQKTE